jgi:hypothetical protein
VQLDLANALARDAELGGDRVGGVGNAVVEAKRSSITFRPRSDRTARRS